MKRLTLLLLLLASVSYGQGVRFGARIGFTVADLIIKDEALIQPMYLIAIAEWSM